MTGAVCVCVWVTVYERVVSCFVSDCVCVVVLVFVCL